MNKSRAGWDGGRSLLGAELPQQAAADSDVYTEEEELSDEELDDDFSDDDERREEESIVATIYHRVKALGFHRLFLVRHAFDGLVAGATPYSTTRIFWALYVVTCGCGCRLRG